MSTPTADSQTTGRPDNPPALPRTGKGKFAPRVVTAQRDARAAELRSFGWTFQRIADELGMANRSVAEGAVKRGLARVTAPGVEALRKSQQRVLDLMKETAVDVLHREHLAHGNGKVVYAGCPGLDYAGNRQHAGCTFNVPGTAYCEGPALRDDGPRLDAVKTLVQVLAREAKLYGADSPVKVETQENGTVRIEITGIDPDKL